ncbi:protein SERAC1 isoform X2 [Leptopilina boulardi]|uniref:protein SERAC1 isoform X2 n=1 Tax=Leptopilina boulardi TaxID=63433 RepID=UPI0021F5E52A|nr:protein SERAC1 isoform X2 [Leptopilina boulardi]
MLLKDYKKYIYYLKSSGICVVSAGGCWILYQLHQISEKVRSSVATNVLQLENIHVQYIYVDDPRLKEIFMFREKEDLNSYVKEKPQNLTNIIMKWWKSLNRSLAYRLLYMARNGSKKERDKAVYSLSNLKHLKDWHYRGLAQMLDARTAVSLARMPNTDLRFFLPPPYFHENHKLFDLIERAHKILLKLDNLCHSCHPCLKQFINRKFKDFHREGLIFDHDLVSVGLAVPPAITWDQEFLQNCVQAIHHHSSLEQHSKDVADVGGLAVLMNIQNKFKDNFNMKILLAKILSNLSLHSDYLDDIFRSGWIGILAAWSRDEDIRLSAPAARALANLDLDDNKGGVFVTWRQRDSQFLSAEIVDPCPEEFDSFSEMIDEYPQEFVKDLAEDLKMREWKRIGHDFEVVLHDCPVNVNYQACGPYTCRGDDKCMESKENRCKTQCWPKDWLSKDVPSVRVIGINYDTNLSTWTPLCPIEGMRSTIKERSDEFIRKLVLAGVGKRPVVWICHSMGGLLAKKMLVEEWKNGDKNNICKMSKGIIFFSTPHQGSSVAALTQATEMLVWPSIEVKELREQSPKLLKLHANFLKMLDNFPMDIVSFSETKSTLVTALRLKFKFVNPKSADPGVGEFFEIPQDHFSICKPANRQSFLYQKVLNIIKRNIENSPQKSKSVKEYFSISNKVS